MQHNQQIALVGKKAPNFSGKAVFDQEFQKIELENYRGQYLVL